MPLPRSPAPAIFAAFLSGCSLLFSPADSEDAENSHLGRAIHSTGIGVGLDFPSIEAWKSGRGGDLGNRQELEVRGSLPAAPRSILVGDQGCAGILIPQNANLVFGTRMTIDLTSTASCSADELLKNEAGDEVAQILLAGPRGITEVVQLHDSAYPPLVIDGFSNTSARSHLVVEPSPGQAHLGIPGQGIVIGLQDGAPQHGVEIQSDYTEFRGFEITGWAAGSPIDGSYEGVHVEANHVLLDSLLVHDDGATDANSESDGIYANDNHIALGDEIELTVRNSFIFNVARSGIHFQGVAGGILRVQNCTLKNCVTSDSQQDKYGCVNASNSETTVEVFNTLAFGQAPDKPAFIVNSMSSFSQVSSNNASDDGSHPGSAGVTVSPANETLQGTDDLHLRPESPVEGQGLSLASFFDTDIDGELRGESWSIGADEPQ